METWTASEIEAAAAGTASQIRPALLQHLAEIDIPYRVVSGMPVNLEMYLAAGRTWIVRPCSKSFKPRQHSIREPSLVICSERSQQFAAAHRPALLAG